MSYAALRDKPVIAVAGFARGLMLTCAGLVTMIAVLVSSPAAADPDTGRIRTMDCGAAGTLTVDLGPAEFITTTSAAIHVVDSTTVLVPRRVVVILPDGETLVTLDKKTTNADITCSYVDPAGNFVTITGKLSRAEVSSADNRGT